MGDVEDVESIAEHLEFNAREKARYELHLEDVKRYSKKVIFWRFWNVAWQIIFFWGLVVIAIEAGQRYSEEFVPSINPMFNYMNYVTFPMAIAVGILGPFSFFIMIYTGLVRGKWEGQLTRSTAYALSFLSNIEHREFMQLEADESFMKRKAKAEVNPEFKEKAAMLKKAMMERKITHVTYNRNLRLLQETYGKGDPPSKHKKEKHYSRKKQ